MSSGGCWTRCVRRFKGRVGERQKRGGGGGGEVSRANPQRVHELWRVLEQVQKGEGLAGNGERVFPA
jgi:hypothetical protein